MENNENRLRLTARGKGAVWASLALAAGLTAAPGVAMADEVGAAPTSDQAAAAVATDQSQTVAAPSASPQDAGDTQTTSSAPQESKKQSANNQTTATGQSSQQTAAAPATPESSSTSTESAAPAATETPAAPSEPASPASAPAQEQPASVANAPAAQYVAESGSARFESLAEAIATCADKGSVTLLGNVNNISQSIDIAGKTVTIDGKGYVISRAKDYTGTIFSVAADGSLELKNVTIDGGAPDWSLDWDHASGPGWYVDVPIIKGENDVTSTAPLVQVEGKLSTQDSTFQNAYTETNIGGVFVRGGAQSVLNLGSGSVFKHGANGANAWNWISGAVRADAGSSVSVTGTQFSNNATRGGGGALALLGGATEKRATIKGCAFDHNFSHYNGGAIHCDPAAIDVLDSKFLYNTVGNDGGDICMEWGVSQDNDAGLAGQDSHFSNNLFEGTRGLATGGQSMGSVFCMYYHRGGKLLFDNCTFKGTSAAAGTIADIGAGTPYTDYSDPANPKRVKGPLQMEFDNCTFQDNSCGTGGVFYQQYVDATLRDCTVIDNRADDGGFAFVDYSSSLSLQRCKVTGNIATYGGGAILLYAWQDYGPKLVVGKDTTITGNTAGAYGGAVYALGSKDLQKRTDISCVFEPGSFVYGNKATKGGDDVAARSNTFGYITLGLESDGYVGGSKQHTDGWYFDAPDARYERNVTDKLSKKQLEVAPDDDNKGLIYLKADASNYTVAFHPGSDDATGTMDNQTLWMKGGVLSANRFSRKGYRFVGWAAAPNGMLAFADGAKVNALTNERGGVVDLYALWEVEPEKPAEPAKAEEPLPETKPAAAAPKQAPAAHAVPCTGDETNSAFGGALAALGAALAAFGFGSRRKSQGE